MAPAYHIASDDGLISIQVESEIDLVDLYELAKSVISADDYDAELPLIMDLRGMRLDWQANPGGIFRGPDGTDWAIVAATFFSWFWPVALVATPFTVSFFAWKHRNPD